MNRRQFVTGLGLGIAALAIAPKTGLALAKAPTRKDRIITPNTYPEGPYFRVQKNGRQVGLVYWTNLDTKEYRRLTLLADFWDDNGPWDGGRVVRHVSVEEARRFLDSLPPARPTDEDETLARMYEDVRQKCHLNMASYPRVPYASLGNRSLSVEGIADQILISSKAPAAIRAMYPDLELYDPFIRS